jgi:MYXO-CTERM domain-containing protein
VIGDGTALAERAITMRFLGLLTALVPVVASLGCNPTIDEHPASMQDDMSTDLLAVFAGNENALDTPYVQGSHFQISVVASKSDAGADWVLRSSDPTVMLIGAQLNESWSVDAVGSGHATLSVVDGSGKVLDSEDVEVDQATQVQLCAIGMLVEGDSDQQSTVSAIRTVSGGTATFYARYYDGTQELFGNNAVQVAGTGVAAASRVSASWSVRDFVAVTASQMGTGGVTLTVGPTTSQLPVEVVDPSNVASVALAPQSESGHKKGDTIFVVARALDGQGNDLFGGEFSWTVNGASLPQTTTYWTGLLTTGTGPSDLLTYQYDPSQTETVADMLGGQTASAQVHGSPATTATDTTANVGCSVARGAGAGGDAAGAGILALAAGLVLRRRRTTSAATSRAP